MDCEDFFDIIAYNPEVGTRVCFNLKKKPWHAQIGFEDFFNSMSGFWNHGFSIWVCFSVSCFSYGYETIKLSQVQWVNMVICWPNHRTLVEFQSKSSWELTKCGSANLVGELGNLYREDIEILILIFTSTISKSC
jgi:hypothetical protein